jgi:hypothetical protein
MSSGFGVARYRAVKRWDPETEDPLCRTIHDFPVRGIAKSAIPNWAWGWLSKYPNARWRDICNSDDILGKVRRLPSILTPQYFIGPLADFIFVVHW